MVFTLFLSLVLSLIAGAFLLILKHHHRSYTTDHLSGPQKLHSNEAIRVGGVAIIIGWSIGLISIYYQSRYPELLKIFITVLPVFIAGLTEDLTRKVRPLHRLFFAFVSAALGIWLLNAIVPRLGIPFVDTLFQSHAVFAYLFTIFVIGGTTHSFNIIDGHNGLSGTISVLILGALSYVAFKLNDFLIVSISFAFIGSIAGFLFWNFPKGYIFAGDGGAYLMGFGISLFTVLLANRHAEISPFFPVLLLLYPVFETLFSMYRRKFIQDRAIARPDSLHLHSIIYKRLVRWIVGKSSKPTAFSNSMTSPYLWTISLTTIVPAMLFWNNSAILLLFIGLYIGFYMWLYKRIVRFRTPRFMTIYRRVELLERKKFN